MLYYIQLTWSIWVDDLSVWKEIEMPLDATCGLLLHLLLFKLRRQTDVLNWAILLQNGDTLLGR